MSENTRTADLSSQSTALGSAGGPSAEDRHGNDTSNSLMSTLPAGAFRTDDHYYYFNGKGPYPGVTSVLEILSKPALIQWKAMESARAMYDAFKSADPVDGHFIGMKDQKEAVNWALKKADESRDTAAKLGTGVHLLADMASRASESDSEGFQVSDEVKPYLEAFRGFLGRYGASNIISSEKMVLNWEGYGGTYDLLMRLPHSLGCWKPNICRQHKEPNDFDLWLIDIKTSKGYYPEYGLQLAGYRWTDVIILEGDPRPYPMPITDRTGILHLRPDLYPDTGYRLIEYPTSDRDYEIFLSLLRAFNWRKEGRFTKSQLSKP